MLIASGPIGTAGTPAKSNSTGLIGFWYWTWSSCAVAPAGANLGIAFSGWVNPQTALQDSANVQDSLPSPRYVCVGGGNTSGAWTSDAVSAVTSAISAGDFSTYQGIAYDIEEGSAGLSAVFQSSFAVAKANGLAVLVTVSHSAPYGVSDAATLMQSFFTNPDIDILSPQLYTTGQESANDYAISGGVTWSDYAAAAPVVAPSIVSASMYPDAQAYFKEYGVTLGGFIQWSQAQPPTPVHCAPVSTRPVLSRAVKTRGSARQLVGWRRGKQICLQILQAPPLCAYVFADKFPRTHKRR